MRGREEEVRRKEGQEVEEEIEVGIASSPFSLVSLSLLCLRFRSLLSPAPAETGEKAHSCL